MSARRRWLTGLVWTNLVVLLAALVLTQGGREPAGLGGWRWAALVVAYANLTAAPAILLLPPLLARLTRGARPPAWLLTLGLVAVTAGGSLLAQVLLLGAGLVDGGRFWWTWGQALRLGLPISLVLGLGISVNESLRARAEEAEAELHRRQVAEERVRKLAAEARLRSLESRLHPHFLFNALNSAAALVAVDPPGAERLLSRLSSLLRAALDGGRRPLVPLREELALLDAYLDIERARLGERLRSSIDVPEELRLAEVPPLSLQVLVENAVKHGVAPQRGGGEVAVAAAPRGGALLLEVSDTGPGFDLAAIPAGRGLDDLVSRLDALFGARAHLSVSRREGRCVVGMLVPRP
ncbi:MAG: histidine kinase [Deltaproteobacteria bacterium]|nr:histidine kinase [Deltaproteobacteria bacterium]